MTDLPESEPRVAGPSRRGFLVMLGTVVLGRFSIPGLADDLPAPSPAATEPQLETVKDRVRRLIIPPSWDEERNSMVYCIGSGDESETRIWIFDSEAERDEARRFYEAATWVPWTTEDELTALVRDPGPWLIRMNRLGCFSYLNTADENYIFSPVEEGEDDAPLFSENADEGVEVSSQKALSIILRYTKEWELEEYDSYLEPVRRAEAKRDFRDERPSAKRAEPRRA
jgi:hypothetical protein